MTAKKYVIGNFKGGVGKSMAAQMLGFDAAFFKGKKTLIVDLDMQGNLSDVMSLTHMNYPTDIGGGDGEPLDYQYTISDVLIGNIITAADNAEIKEMGTIFAFDPHVKEEEKVDVKKAIYKVIDNLYVLPADMGFEMYDDWIKEKFPESIDRFRYMEERLSPIFDEFEIIYIDVPPSISVYSKSAMYLADWAIVVLQTQVKSMKNAMQYLEYMDFFCNQFETKLKVAGVIPFMLDTGDSVDQQMYEKAKEIYGEHLLNNVVLKNARLKRYDGSGITTERTKKNEITRWDNRCHQLFCNIYDELEEHEKWYE